MNDYETEHLARLRQYLPECMVLLKSNGDFPLDKPGKIAVYGNGARRTVKGGTGSGEVNSRFFETVENGLDQAGFTITTRYWMDAYDQVASKAKAAFNKHLKAKAKREHKNVLLASLGAVMPEPEYDIPFNGDGDVAIYVLARISGEGSDRNVQAGDVLLTQTEQRSIHTLARQYKKFMLVLNVGGVVDLSPVMDIDNILLLSQLGTQTGGALADVLCGKASPSGKLTTTWSAAGDYADIGDFACADDTRYNEGIYVGYRYFDTAGKRALFPFGFGKTYTSFNMTAANVALNGQRMRVSARVANTGTVAAKEVAQVYVSVPSGDVDQPYQALAGFAKTQTVAPDQSTVVDIDFDMRDLASFSADKCANVLESGDYIVRLGNSSVDTTVCAVINVPETIIVEQLEHKLGTPDFADYVPKAPRAQDGRDADVPHFTLAADAIQTRAVDYHHVIPGLTRNPRDAIRTRAVDYHSTDSQAIDPAVAALTDEDAVRLNIGAFDPKGGIASVIGAASTTVAGASGETAHVAGFPYLVMADGPAGLRLSKEFYRDDKGAHSIGNSIPQSIVELMPWYLKLLVGFMNPKAKRGAAVEAQYATAIPIGTAIAQSFNLHMAQVCGDIVGSEMERFGVNLWLAPALNIHRSILCGRDFEYFSEDPLVSGMFAAAITMGVQSHAGCGVTVKHYAANNQETNRYANNSVVSERAMRDIYLKGFGICVKESQPRALMTSYNLVNGQHTSESRDMVQDILRAEFGFKGVVMTDWVIAGDTMTQGAKYPAPKPRRVAAAGGDLMMPGSKDDYDDLLAGLKAGDVTREQLDINGTRVYHLACELNRRP